MQELQTPRLRLIPATVVLARAEIESRPLFAELLGATIPDNWPPEMLADALPFFLQMLEERPNPPGWWSWYGLRTGAPDKAPILIASGGFMGWAADGFPEIGYSVLPEFQRQGYATEMMDALIDWALAQPGTRGVVAEADKDNVASVRLLEKRGFAIVGDGREPGHRRFLLTP